MPDTERELAELDAAATPGPWHVSEAAERTVNGPSLHKQECDPHIYSSFIASTDALADAALIVWLRNNAPALIASQAAEIGEIRRVAVDAIAHLHGWEPDYARSLLHKMDAARLATHREADTDQEEGT